MAKKQRFSPAFIMLSSSSGGDVIVIGDGSGEGADRPVPCNFNSWKNSIWAEDTVGPDGAIGEDGLVDEWDYGAWWSANDFSQEDWEEMNPGLDYDTYVF